MMDKNGEQAGQSSEGSQINVGGDVHIDHAGDKIDTGGGDFVARDKIEIINQYKQEKIIVSVESLRAVEQLEPTPGEPPYKGMTYFTEADKDIYFGREALSDEVVGRLQKGHFLAIVGASGSGKSSLLRAGVVPGLRARNWAIKIIKPGADPLTALAAAITAEGASPAAIKEMRESLIRDPETVRFAAAKLASQAGAERLLLAVDQFEELFTQCKEEKERQAFVANLLNAARVQGETTVLVSMRADFYDRVSEFAALAELVSQEQEYVTPLSEEELLQVIAEPAKRDNWQLLEGLLEQIVEDVGQEPGRLPLLSHALLETWERRRGTVMTLGGYRDAGGVEGAIAQTAEETLEKLIEEDPDYENVTREIFLDLTELGEGTVDTRRAASRHELAIGVDSGALDIVLEALVEARLITVREGEVEVAHEALIRRWPTLQEWLADNRERLRFERQLKRDAQQWLDLGRDDGVLYRGARLVQASELVDSGNVKLAALPVEFLSTSREQEEREEWEREAQRQRELENAQAREQAEIEARSAAVAQQQAEEQARQRAEADAVNLRRRAFYLISAFVAAIVLAFVAIYFFRNAERQGRVTLGHSLAALSSTVNPNITDMDLNLLLALEVLHLHKEFKSNTQFLADESLRDLLSRPDLMHTLFGHTGWVSSVAFSPDGQQIASGSGDETVRVWDLANPTAEPLLLSGHSGPVYAVAFSPNGQQIASGSKDQTVRMWDLANPAAEPLVLNDHSGPVYSVTFSPDGKQIASGSEDQTVRVWDLASPVAKPLVLRGYNGRVSSLAFAPDGEQIASGGGDEGVRVWELNNPAAEPLLLSGHTGEVYSVAFGPNGQQIASGSLDETVRVWDLANPAAEPLLLSGHNGPVWSVTFAPDGEQIASSSDDETVRVWDLASPETEPLLLSGHTGSVWSVAFAPDGQQIASGSEDETVRVWELANPAAEPLLLSGHTLWVNSVAFSPDGQQIASGSSDQTVRVWNLNNPAAEPLLLSGHTGMVYSLAFAPDGQQIASGSTDQMVRVWDLTNPAAEPLVLNGHSGGVSSVAFAPNGQQIASGSSDETVRVWDLANPAAEVLLLRGHIGWVNSVTFSPDGQQIASSGEDETVRVWDLTNPTAELLLLSGHIDQVNSVTFSPDGQQIASGSYDQTVRLWDLANPAVESLLLSGHTGGVTSVAFAPDGQQIASSGEDETVRVWDLANLAAEPLVLSGHTGGVNSVAFAPDGQQIASGSDDGTVRVWPALERLAELACQQVSRGGLTEAEWKLYVGEVMPWREEGQCDLERGVPVWWEKGGE